MAQSEDDLERDLKAVMGDLWFLHAETLQTEVERQVLEINELKALLAQAERGNSVACSGTGAQSSGASCATASIVEWAGGLLLDPAATLKRLSTDLKAAKALDDATAACQDKAITDHLHRVKVWARAQKSPS